MHRGCACGKMAAVPGTRERAAGAAETKPGETGARMNLEDEIIAVEESAAKIIAAAQAEAKKLLGTAEELRKRIREESVASVESEKGSLAREHAAALKSSLAEIAREQARGEAAVGKDRGARVDGCVREIVGMIQKG